jgi:hypothetical protein
MYKDSNADDSTSILVACLAVSSGSAAADTANGEKNSQDCHAVADRCGSTYSSATTKYDTAAAVTVPTISMKSNSLMTKQVPCSRLQS